MRIAFLCWGSLYWSPGILRINGNWHHGGPALPIEFARISADGRATLVICEDNPAVEPVAVLWAEAGDTDLDEAKKNLAQRENRDLIGRENDADFSARVDQIVNCVRAADAEPAGNLEAGIWVWARENGFEAVVWTALKSNWHDHRQPEREELRRLVRRPFTCNNLKAYLRGLKNGQASSDQSNRVFYAKAFEEAERYIRLAPTAIMTRCRHALIEDPDFGWTPYETLGVGGFGRAKSAGSGSPAENGPISSGTAWWDRRTRGLASVFSRRGNRRPDVAPERTDDAASDDFRQLFTKTSALLEYLLTEGYPYHVPDRVIDEIEAARDLLAGPGPVAKEERAKLVKAYRDLVDLPQVSVTFEGMPPPHFWSAGSPWRRLLFWGAGAPAALATIGLALSPARHYWYIPLLCSIIIGFVLAGVYAFTGVASNRKLNQMITFCYVFTGLALVSAVLPFAMPSFFPNSWATAPLGLLQGCAAGDQAPSAPAPPGEVQCNPKASNDHHQWVVNIGGTPIWPIGREPTPAAGNAAPAVIYGGLVVPLYIIVLALFGGAISMTRRVPEYQRRGMDSKDPLTNVQARENLVFQIMQVMSAPLIAVTTYYVIKPDNQTVSAVLGFGSGFASEPILLMIRNLVEKLSPMKSAEPGTAPISVRVSPATATLKPNQTQQFAAKVTGSPNPDVTWQIDPADGTAGTISQSGHYVAPAASPGKAVTITASSAADRTRSGSASVAIAP